MSAVHEQNAFERIQILCKSLYDDSFLTSYDRNFYDGYVQASENLYSQLKYELSFVETKYDDRFYKELFFFGDNNVKYPDVAQDDLFYPLLEQTKKMLSDLSLYKKYYDTIFILEKKPNITEPCLWDNIIHHRKVFLKDVTKLICDKYTFKVKNIECRKNSDANLKAKIDSVYIKEIEAQHFLLFADIDDFTKETNDFIEICKYMKMFKNPVNEICTLPTDKIVGNETKTYLLDHNVKGCPEFNENILTTTTITSEPLTKKNRNDV